MEVKFLAPLFHFVLILLIGLYQLLVVHIALIIAWHLSLLHALLDNLLLEFPLLKTYASSGYSSYLGVGKL